MSNHDLIVAGVPMILHEVGPEGYGDALIPRGFEYGDLATREADDHRHMVVLTAGTTSLQATHDMRRTEEKDVARVSLSLEDLWVPWWANQPPSLTHCDIGGIGLVIAGSNFA